MTDVQLVVADAADLSGALRREIIELCEAAYDEDFSRLFEELPGSTHVLARMPDGALVSHAEIVARWLQPGDLPPLRTAYIEAVATASAWQRRGFATRVLDRLMEIVEADSSWQLAALSPAVPDFYARRGWEAWSGPLAIRRGDVLEPTSDDELVMIRRLATTPTTMDLSSRLTAEWRRGELW